MELALLHQRMLEVTEAKKAFQKELDEMNLALFQHACDFDTYQELYCFAKRNSDSLEDFNEAMLFCRQAYLARQR